MSFNGFHHIGLRVADMEKSLKFYTEGLGGKVTFSFQGGSGKTIYLVDLGGNAVVELLPGGDGAEEANARWAHVAVRTDDAAAAYEKALKAGAQTHSAPKDVTLGSMSVIAPFVYGPDKELIEFFQIVKE